MSSNGPESSLISESGDVDQHLEVQSSVQSMNRNHHDPNLKRQSSSLQVKDVRLSLASNFLKQAACYEYKPTLNDQKQPAYDDPLNTSQLSFQSSIRSERLSKLQRVVKDPKTYTEQVVFENLPQLRGSIDQLEALGKIYIEEGSKIQRQQWCQKNDLNESKEFDFLVEIEESACNNNVYASGLSVDQFNAACEQQHEDSDRSVAGDEAPIKIISQMYME